MLPELMQTMCPSALTDVEVVRRAALRALTEAIVLAFQLRHADLDASLERLRVQFFTAPATREAYGAVLDDALVVLDALNVVSSDGRHDA